MNKTEIALAVIAAVSLASNLSGVRRYVVALAQKLEAEAKHILADVEAKDKQIVAQISNDTKIVDAKVSQVVAKV